MAGINLTQGITIILLLASSASAATTAAPATTAASTNSSAGSDADSDLTLTITDTSLEVGLDKFFDVECMYNRSDKTEQIGVTAMQLEHKPAGKTDFEDIASIVIDMFGDGSVPSKVKHYKDLGGIVSGLLTKDGSAETFIKFEWIYPEEAIIGEFRCFVQTMDSMGGVQRLEKTLELTQTNVSLATVIQRVVGIDLNVDKLQEAVARVDSRTASIRDRVITRELVYDGTTYLLAKNLWSSTLAAQTLCQVNGAYLVEVNSEAEWAAVKAFVQGETGPILVGATNKRDMNNWVYMKDHTPVQFFKWALDADKFNQNQRCLMLKEGGQGWAMDTIACNGMNYETFMCEKPEMHKSN